MSSNLIKHNDVWDDSELIKRYEESCKKLTKAIIANAELVVPVSKECSSNEENDYENDIEQTSPNSHQYEEKEDGEMDDEDEEVPQNDEDEEEGEIRENSTIVTEDRLSVKRSLESLENTNHNENSVDSNQDDGLSAKKLKLETIPEDDNSSVDESQTNSQLPSSHPSHLTSVFIAGNNDSSVINPNLKVTLNATLGSYWQAGFHIKNLENSLNLEPGSLKIPSPVITQNCPEKSEKLNAALISYWQMGYYDAHCQLMLDQ